MVAGDVNLLSYALVALVAFLAATIGGVAGYGTVPCCRRCSCRGALLIAQGFDA
jgi:hypothetical protein